MAKEKSEKKNKVDVDHETVLCSIIDKVKDIESAIAKMAHMTGQDKIILEFGLDKYKPKSKV